MNRSEQVFEFKDEFDHITKKIENKEHMALVRWGDGEYFLLKESSLSPASVDKWGWSGGPSNAKEDILKSFALEEPNFYHGITCEDWSFRYNNEAINYMLSNIKQPIEYITYASIFIDDNYKHFKKWFKTLEKHEIIFIINEGFTHPFGDDTAETYYLPDDLVNLYETQRDTYIAKYTEIAKKHKDRIFFFAGGPVAKSLIYHMWLANPLNTYIDVGSAIDQFTKGKKTRAYQYLNTKESVRRGKPFTRSSIGNVSFL